ncbi:LysE family translocator [Desulfoluna sp.]|uniref:LysE family translocator n=1 Tax=Desulfoluna sp. TaxID=2045199 RepID=UPI00262BDC03|nr:LysE family translocator [Desulfoluna sp.]
MDLLSFTALASAMVILALTPGPGVFATIATALSSGFRATLSLIFGLVTGDICYLLFAIFGLSLVAEAMGAFFIFIKIGAGAYLVYLGVRLLFAAPCRPEDTPPSSTGKTYLSGLFITLANPKVILFYCGFLPAFMDLKALTPTGVALTALTVATVVTTVLCGYALLASRARSAMTQKNALKAIQSTEGGLMITAGLKLAADIASE